MKNLFLLLLTLFISACTGLGEGGSTGGKASDNKNFYQHWVHSYEEQNGAKTPNIFRPAGSRQFPSSRFRMEFGFDPNGQCNYKYLSPTDAHEMRNCIYTKIGKQVYIYDDSGKLLPQISFVLLEPASNNQMRIRYGIQQPKKKQVKKK